VSGVLDCVNSQIPRNDSRRELGFALRGQRELAKRSGGWRDRDAPQSQGWRSSDLLCPCFHVIPRRPTSRLWQWVAPTHPVTHGEFRLRPSFNRHLPRNGSPHLPIIIHRQCRIAPADKPCFIRLSQQHTDMASKPDAPPPYGGPPQAPKPTYGNESPGPYGQDQRQGYYPPGGPSGPQQNYYQQQGPQQGYYQPGPQMGYYNQQQGPYPSGQGPYPPQGQYGPGPGGYQQGPGYVPQQRQSAAPGLCGGLLAGLACCCCLDLLF